MPKVKNTLQPDTLISKHTITPSSLENARVEKVAVNCLQKVSYSLRSLQKRVVSILSLLSSALILITYISRKILFNFSSTSFIELAAIEGNIEVLQAAKTWGYDLSSIRENISIDPSSLKNEEKLKQFLQLQTELGGNISPLTTQLIAKKVLVFSESEQDLKIIRTLCEYGADVNWKAEKGYTSLHLAADNGHFDLAKLLIEKKADLDIKADPGCTSLHLAALKGHFTIVQLLVEKGADLNVRDNQGFTPLHLAVLKGHFDVAKLLIEQGANLKAKDQNDKTPLQLAALKKNRPIVELLVEKVKEANS